jgi:hypothetical protein
MSSKGVTGLRLTISNVKWLQQVLDLYESRSSQSTRNFTKTARAVTRL